MSNKSENPLSHIYGKANFVLETLTTLNQFPQTGPEIAERSNKVFKTKIEEEDKKLANKNSQKSR